MSPDLPPTLIQTAGATIELRNVMVQKDLGEKCHVLDEPTHLRLSSDLVQAFGVQGSGFCVSECGVGVSHGLL
eukprot:1930723-Rhodomonas_salina.1